MSYTNKYYPDYEKIYPDVKLTPAVLAVLRQSDRQMRRFEEELKAEHFEFDNEKRIARFMPSREDSYERLLEEGHLQFGSEDIDVESLVLRRESIRCLQRAMQHGSNCAIMESENQGKGVMLWKIWNCCRQSTIRE